MLQSAAIHRRTAADDCGRDQCGRRRSPASRRSTAPSREFAATFDARRGGFGTAPKFPRPSELLFLLREHARTGDGEPRDMALATLRAMALGGMRDHLGGGFHRYSVDGDWRVPHFEKMLYDQAQLALAYVEASQVTGDLVYLDVALDTLEYVRRDLTDPDGGFYSAEDADSVPPEQAGHARRAQDGGRVLHLARCRRSGSCWAPTPTSSGCASASSPTATRHRIRRASSPAANLLYTARAARVGGVRVRTERRRRAGRRWSKSRLTLFERRETGRGRISTTRC